MPSDLACSVLEQLKYPCKYDTAALKKLEARPNARPQSAPPMRGNSARKQLPTQQKVQLFQGTQAVTRDASVETIIGLE